METQYPQVLAQKNRSTGIARSRERRLVIIPKDFNCIFKPKDLARNLSVRYPDELEDRAQGSLGIAGRPADFTNTRAKPRFNFRKRQNPGKHLSIMRTAQSRNDPVFVIHLVWVEEHCKRRIDGVALNRAKFDEVSIQASYTRVTAENIYIGLP